MNSFQKKLKQNIKLILFTIFNKHQEVEKSKDYIKGLIYKAIEIIYLHSSNKIEYKINIISIQVRNLRNLV